MKKPVAPFTCAGRGIKPGPNAATHASEPQQRGTCAYADQWRSDTDRTNGRGTWPVTATTSWTVTWTSNIGIAGVLTLTRTANQQVSVIQWRSELVVGPTRRQLRWESARSR